MRERAALRTLQRCFRQKKQAKAAIEAEKANETAKEGSDALGSPSDEVAKDETEADTSPSNGEAMEGTNAFTSPPDEVVKEKTEADTFPSDGEAKEGTDAITSPPDETAKGGTDILIPPPDEAAKEESEADTALPSIDVPRSPRVTERLNEARDLDALLNSEGVPDEAA